MMHLSKCFLQGSLKRCGAAFAFLVLPVLVIAQPTEVRDWSNPRIDQQVISHSRTWWAKDVAPDEDVTSVVTTPRDRPKPKPPVEVESTDTKRPKIDSPAIPFGQLGLTQRIYFDFDRSSIRPDQEAGLRQNLKWLREHPEAGVLLEGHCDERGTIQYNVALGEHRADSVREYLQRGGIAASRIVTKSWGEERPLDFGKAEEAYARNRRVEFFKIEIK